MVDVEKTLVLKYPNIVHYPVILRNFVVYFLKKVLHQEEINTFLTHKIT